MGGYSDEIRGRSKAEVYFQYAEHTDTEMFAYRPDPKYKKVCKQQMLWDPKTEEWVLPFHGHT